MISVLQQFYMLPIFRYSILKVDDGIQPTNLAWKNGEEVDTSIKGYDVDDNFLH